MRYKRAAIAKALKLNALPFKIPKSAILLILNLTNIVTTGHTMIENNQQQANPQQANPPAAKVGIPHMIIQIIENITATTYAEAPDIALWSVDRMVAHDFAPVGADYHVHMTTEQAAQFLRTVARRVAEALEKAKNEHDERLSSRNSPPPPEARVLTTSTSKPAYATMLKTIELLKPPEGHIGFADNEERNAMLTPKSTPFGDHDKLLRAFTEKCSKPLKHFLFGPTVDISSYHPYLQEAIKIQWEENTSALRVSWIRARIHGDVDLSYSANSVIASIASNSDVLARPDRKDDPPRRPDDRDESAKKKPK